MTPLESQLRASVALIETRKAAEQINTLNEHLNDRVMDLQAENGRLNERIAILEANIQVLERRPRMAIVGGTEIRNIFTHTRQI